MYIVHDRSNDIKRAHALCISTFEPNLLRQMWWKAADCLVALGGETDLQSSESGPRSRSGHSA